MDILEGLNPAQREAVTADDGPVLVLAGPGSGKTRVLTHRVAYLIRERGISPRHIMAVTFTNKAAREMKERLYRLLGSRFTGLTVGTFHAICARILRREGERLGIPSHFVIYDEAEQLALIRRALRELNLDEKLYRPSSIHGAISRAKDELVGPEDYQPRSYREEVVRRVYLRYQELLASCGALDFDDLLRFTVRLFSTHPQLLTRYQRRYTHLLVDEWQDTNYAQYRLMHLLARQHRNLFVVADEDQSIYSWRGADFRNIERFRQDFPEHRLILLERNYRSTNTILEVANSVISRNVHRTPKRLYTDKGQGPPVVIHQAYDEQDEAFYVAEEIRRLVEEGEAQPGDCAVMYRTNAQSRALEEAFLRLGMPYKLVGALRFYQRREIKDVLAYLRLIRNPYDVASLTRIINVPPRGIGTKTMAALERLAGEEGSFYGALMRLRSEETLAPTFRRALLRFLDLLEELTQAAKEHPLPDLFDFVLERTGYADYLRDGTPQGEERWENVQELRNVASRYAELPPPEGLAAFLDEVSLVSDVDDLEEQVEVPTLLTLHMAKGLEFGVVFIIGLEEGLLPHFRSMDTAEELEEERRLFYVGITRAKERLYLVHASRRLFFGEYMPSPPSRFLRDVPSHLAESSGLRVKVEGRERAPLRPYVPSFAIGQRVRHPSFGEGIVLEVKRAGDDEEVVVAFEEVGTKRLLASLARLEKL